MNRASWLGMVRLTMLAPAMLFAAEAEARVLKGHEGSVMAVAFSPETLNRTCIVVVAGASWV
jgi:hypothetical protein